MMYQRIVDDARGRFWLPIVQARSCSGMRRQKSFWLLGLRRDRAFNLIIPEAQRARHWDGYRPVMQTGVSRYTSDVLAVPALCADGSAPLAGIPRRSPAKCEAEVTGIVAIIRDVMARWQQDRALRQRLQALEAERQ